jgi:hypothetical protein
LVSVIACVWLLPGSAWISIRSGVASTETCARAGAAAVTSAIAAAMIRAC